MLEEKEFFIRKAIGWVLREAGKRRPDEVAAWLAPRTGRASGVTMREAVKYLPAADRERADGRLSGEAAGRLKYRRVPRFRAPVRPRTDGPARHRGTARRTSYSPWPDTHS